MYWSQIQFYDKWNVWSLEEEISTVISYEMEEVRNCSTSAIRHPSSQSRQSDGELFRANYSNTSVESFIVLYFCILYHNSY